MAFVDQVSRTLRSGVPDRFAAKPTDILQNKAKTVRPNRWRNIAISLIDPWSFLIKNGPVARNFPPVITYLIVPDIWKGSRVYLCLRALVPVMLA